ncbi:MAG: AAA family ATPase [Saprospiraceae bacterium]
MTSHEGIIGRKTELEILESVFKSSKSEFVILYGRRRVGKTFLVNRMFREHFTFRVTALAKGNLDKQLTNFQASFNAVADARHDLATAPENWFAAFQSLIKLAEADLRPRKVIFFDELPWFDTHGSDFLTALEHFWNSWASFRSDVLLIACGSAASWMLNQLIHNHGGLHNRITERIPLEPFTLAETEEFLRSKGGVFDRYQIAELYMTMGGIPFYLENVQVNRSVAQNIDRMFFSARGMLRTEYSDLYRSLFKNPARHIAIVESLSQKAKGLTRKDIVAAAKLPDGGTLTKTLDELQQSGFVRRYLPFGKNKRDALYQLIDPFTLFFLTFVRDSKAEGEGAWLAQLASPRWQAWSGYAFEYLCRNHIGSIKKQLGIGGVYTEISAWRSQKNENGAQIDLIIDRKDRVVNICEMKFSTEAFTISKSYAENLRHKISTFREETKTKKALFLTLISAHGLKPNEHSLRLVNDSLDLDALFVL